MKCSDFDRELRIMIDIQSVHLDSSLRQHLDTCKTCWEKFVAIRWKISENSNDLVELKEFLGEEFAYGIDSSWELAKDWNFQDRNSAKSIIDFYKNTHWYIYNLTLWSASGQRPHYVNMAAELLRNYSVNSILDFGAGVGTDVMYFIALGFKVETFEINTLCNSFLNWRKNRQNLEIVIHTDYSTIPDNFDLLWAMDVVEHLQDPVTALAPLLKKCKIFIYDCEYDGNSKGRHPFHFQHDENKLYTAFNELCFIQVKSRNELKNFNVFIRNEYFKSD